MSRILHIGKFYPPHRGGMEKVVYDLVRRQNEKFDVSVLCCGSERRTLTENRDNARITRVSSFGSVASMPVCPELILRIRDFAPDLIHLHTPNPLGALALASKSFKCPVVVHHHSDILGRRLLRLASSPINRFALRRADAIIATSLRYLQSSPELRPYRSKTVVIPCGINVPEATSEALASAARIRESIGRRLVLAIGRLVPYKGFSFLIEAMRSVDGTLVLIGDGPLRPTLTSQIQKADLTKRVHLLSGVEDVVPYVRAADVFALPSVSRAEAFGLVQVEAMACGTPVVNTNVDSGVPEISVHGVTGLTVPPGNPEAFGFALNQLLNDEKLRTTYGSAARLRAHEHFTADLMAQRTEALYKNLGVLAKHQAEAHPAYEPAAIASLKSVKTLT